MSKGKNHNSFLFLTTLGVYLGLVLVGGTAPQVFAHSATTRNFEILDEIEVKDDLDRMPDDEIRRFAHRVEEYLEELQEFIEDLRKLHKIDQFSPSYHAFDGARMVDPARPEPGKPTANLDRWLGYVVNEQKYKFEYWNWDLSECLSETEIVPGKLANFRTSYDKSELVFQIGEPRKSPADAQKLVGKLEKALKFYDVTDESAVIQVLHKHTSFSSSDNQVFVVTRLPRAALDPLFATNAK